MTSDKFAATARARDAAFAEFEAWQAAEPAVRCDDEFGDWLAHSKPALFAAVCEMEQAA